MTFGEKKLEEKEDACRFERGKRSAKGKRERLNRGRATQKKKKKEELDEGQGGCRFVGEKREGRGLVIRL